MVGIDATSIASATIFLILLPHAGIEQALDRELAAGSEQPVRILQCPLDRRERILAFKPR